MKHTLNAIFPTPIYTAKRDSVVEEEEKKDIATILKNGQGKRREMNNTNTFSSLVDTCIFDTKLYKLKEFCEEHINIYVKEILNPKQELDFYITQSWLNVVQPGGSIQSHWHGNSIISGSFYPAVEKTGSIL